MTDQKGEKGKSERDWKGGEREKWGERRDGDEQRGKMKRKCRGKKRMRRGEKEARDTLGWGAVPSEAGREG